MNVSSLTYAVITPARNESDNLVRLYRCLAAQSIRPACWLIVDNGSEDETPDVLQRLAARNSWIATVAIAPASGLARGGPIVRAFHAGLEALDVRTDVVVKLDADVSFAPDYFEQVLAAFTAQPTLGIASGSGYERQDGAWLQRLGTGASVWGATRAYRRACLDDVLPLEERMGWDGIDAFKAKARGWETRTLLDVPFRHHRREGERDGGRLAPWIARGRASHYMGYRVSYLVARTLHNALADPAAVGILWGYLHAFVRRESICPDEDARGVLRQEQRLRNLARRRREVVGVNSW